MKVSVKIGGKVKRLSLGKGTTIDGLLKEIKVNRETVLVMLNGKLCVEEETLKNGDSVEIVPAVSGG